MDLTNTSSNICINVMVGGGLVNDQDCAWVYKDKNIHIIVQSVWAIPWLLTLHF